MTASTARRTAALASVAGLAVVALSACSPPQTGVVGVAADAQGRPVGVLAVCSGSLNTASMVALERPSGDDTTSSTGEPTPGPTLLPSPVDPLTWRSPEPVTDVGIWSVTTGEPWSSATAPPLRPGVTYSIGAEDVTYRDGDTIGRSAYAAGVEFTLADVAALQPGQVRYASGIDEQTLAHRYSVVEVTQFRETACRR